jgi:hypothetical protein
MVTQHEIDTLRGAFKEILKQSQVFERCLADSRTLLQLSAMAQGIIHDAGYINGYDWRSIHVVVKIVDNHYAYIDPRPLTPHADELVQKAMEYALDT